MFPIVTLAGGSSLFTVNNSESVTMSYKSSSASWDKQDGPEGQFSKREFGSDFERQAAVKRARNQISRGKYNLRQAYKNWVCFPAPDRWLGATAEKGEIWAHECTHHGWGSMPGGGPLVTPIEENSILTWGFDLGSQGPTGGSRNMVAGGWFSFGMGPMADTISDLAVVPRVFDKIPQLNVCTPGAYFPALSLEKTKIGPGFRQIALVPNDDPPPWSLEKAAV